MTVDQLTLAPSSDQSVGGVTQIRFCESHHASLRSMLIDRGFGDELLSERDLTDEEYLRMAESGERNAMMEVTQTMIMGVIATMGPVVFGQYGGCPVCVLEGTLERSCDEITMRRRKSS